MVIICFDEHFFPLGCCGGGCAIGCRSRTGGRRGGSARNALQSRRRASSRSSATRRRRRDRDDGPDAVALGRRTRTNRGGPARTPWTRRGPRRPTPRRTRTPSLDILIRRRHVFIKDWFHRLIGCDIEMIVSKAQRCRAYCTASGGVPWRKIRRNMEGLITSFCWIKIFQRQ